MRRRLPQHVALLTLVALTSFSVCTQVVRAQSDEALVAQQVEDFQQRGIEISPEEAQKMISIQRHMRELAAMVEQEAGFNLGSGGAATAVPVNLRAPLSNIRGEEGIPFPKPEEVIQRPFPTISLPPFVAPTPAPLWTPLPYDPPAKCESNNVTREVVYPDADDSEIIRDKLFLDEALVPLDSAEVFGSSVTLEPYKLPLDQGTLDVMSFYKVPCLPYRIRRTLQAEYRLFGLHALRTYDGVPTGKEKIHSFIRQKLNPETSPRRAR